MSKDQRLKKKIRAEKYTREAEIVTDSFNADDNTVELSFSSDTPVLRFFGYEVLDHRPEGVDFSRLNDGGPVLDNHRGDQIGIIEKAKLADGKGRARIRFSENTERAKEIAADVRDGIRRGVSVGYEIGEVERMSDAEDGAAVYRMQWTPYEVSMVPVAADPTVGVGRSADDEDDNGEQDSTGVDSGQVAEANRAVEEKQNTGSITMEESGITQDQADQAARDAATGAATAERERAAEITRLGEHFGVAEFARESVASGMSLPEFQEAAFNRAVEKTKNGVEGKQNSEGMKTREIHRYSLVKALREIGDAGGDVNGLTGLEREMHDEGCKRTGTGEPPQGLYIPHDVTRAPCCGLDVTREQFAETLNMRHFKRDLNVNTDSLGGFTVAEDLLSGSMIELLRNSMQVRALGATILGGLQGDVAIPKQTGPGTAAYYAEAGTAVNADQTFGQVPLKPHRLVAVTGYTQQLLMQSSIDIEAFVRTDLMQVIALRTDLAALAGTGAGPEPRGILNTTGINSVTFGGAPTWAKVVEFETDVAEDNALLGSLAYLTTAGVRGAWKTTEKASGTAQFIWGSDNEVNGYRSATTQQISGNLVYFGDWSSLIIAEWAGMDVIVDPFSRKKEGVREIQLTTFNDIGVRHPESFAVSSDAGNQ